jgi:hypothetical protein
MAVGTYALITLQELKDQLGITVSTDDTQLERAIDRATARIEAFCGRLIKARSHTEWYGGNSTRAIRLKQYPVTVVSGVYTGMRTAFTFASTVSSDNQPHDLDGLNDDNDARVLDLRRCRCARGGDQRAHGRSSDDRVQLPDTATAPARGR